MGKNKIYCRHGNVPEGYVGPLEISRRNLSKYSENQKTQLKLDTRTDVKLCGHLNIERKQLRAKASSHDIAPRVLLRTNWFGHSVGSGLSCYDVKLSYL